KRTRRSASAHSNAATPTCLVPQPRSPWLARCSPRNFSVSEKCMNDQLASLIRTLLKYGAGILVTKGITDSSTAEIIISGLVALLGVLWSWAHHAAAGAAATEAGARAAKPNGPSQGAPA